MRTLKSLLLLIALVVSISAASAQVAPSAILGTVTDSSGAVLGAVDVTITNAATGDRRVVQTSADGNYVAENMSPGTYEVTAKKSGFKETKVAGVVLEVAQRARIDVAMQVGTVTEQVEVQGATPTLETDTSSVGKVISTQEVLNLPLNGREFLQLATLIPGVSKTYSPSDMETTGGSVSEDGMSNSSNNTMVDGVMNQETGAARMTFSPSVDMIQEFKMQTNSYDAVYHRVVRRVRHAVLSEPASFPYSWNSVIGDRYIKSRTAKTHAHSKADSTPPRADNLAHHEVSF